MFNATSSRGHERDNQCALSNQWLIGNSLPTDSFSPRGRRCTGIVIVCVRDPTARSSRCVLLIRDRASPFERPRAPSHSLPDSFMIIKDGEAPVDSLSSPSQRERERGRERKGNRETLKARVRYSGELSFSHSSGHLYAFAASSRIRFFREFITPGRQPNARFTSLSENPR